MASKKDNRQQQQQKVANSPLESNPAHDVSMNIDSNGLQNSLTQEGLGTNRFEDPRPKEKSGEAVLREEQKMAEARHIAASNFAMNIDGDGPEHKDPNKPNVTSEAQKQDLNSKYMSIDAIDNLDTRRVNAIANSVAKQPKIVVEPSGKNVRSILTKVAGKAVRSVDSLGSEIVEDVVKAVGDYLFQLRPRFTRELMYCLKAEDRNIQISHVAALKKVISDIPNADHERIANSLVATFNEMPAHFKECLAKFYRKSDS